MRISDWSSDVCSSDLLGAVVVLRAQQIVAADRRAEALPEFRRQALKKYLAAVLRCVRAKPRPAGHLAVVVGETRTRMQSCLIEFDVDALGQIGRAHV